MKDDLQFDEIGYWSEIKLEIQKEYAAAYSTILAAQKSPPLHHVYMVQPPFHEYHLIDIKPEKVENLKALIGPRNDVTVYQGDCN